LPSGLVQERHKPRQPAILRGLRLQPERDPPTPRGRHWNGRGPSRGPCRGLKRPASGGPGRPNAEGRGHELANEGRNEPGSWAFSLASWGGKIDGSCARIPSKAPAFLGGAFSAPLRLGRDTIRKRVPGTCGKKRVPGRKFDFEHVLPGGRGSERRGRR